jgi:hypothetical protein
VIFSVICGCFFGKTLFVSEKKQCRYFGDIDFPPIADKMALADKTIVHYWWNRPNWLLENQLVRAHN